MEILPLALSIVTIFTAIYYYVLKKQNIFKEHGIPYIPPNPLLGSFGPIVFRRLSISDLQNRMYYTYPEARYVGMQDFSSPAIMLRDIDLIKFVTMKNIESFSDRRPFSGKDIDPLLSNTTFFLKGEEWKQKRSTVSPTFTSSKIKNMFPLILMCAKNFADYSFELPEKECEVELKTLLTKYTNDVITSCAFGVSVDSKKDPSNPFYVHGRKATNFESPKVWLKIMMYNRASWLSRVLNLSLIEKDTSDFFYNVISSTVKARDEQGISRPDMIQLLMEARNKKEPGKGLTIDDITCTASAFFFGGLDTVASQLSFILYTLAVNPDARERLQQEIDQTLEETQGQVTYDAITGMEYLDAVINESMRLAPVLPSVSRVCTKRFELPPPLPGGKPFIVEPGTGVWIPVHAIQHDPKYFEDPEKFDPERFLKDGKRIINSGTFLSFGIGPRMCIGNRFALINMKVLLFFLLSRCDVKRSSKTAVPLVLAKGTFIMAPRNGFWVKIEPRTNPHPLAHASSSMKRGRQRISNSQDPIGF